MTNNHIWTQMCISYNCARSPFTNTTYNTQLLETGGRESAKKKGGWASWTAQALFAWTRTHDEPGKSKTCGYIAAGLLRSGVSFGHRAPARFWTVGAKASLLDACFRVFARCAKKKISTLSLRSAVENGSLPPGKNFFLL